MNGALHNPLLQQAATLIVAASDSLHPERADYQCNGVADEVQIQAAIDALPFEGGKVLLLDGNFTLAVDASINLAGKSGIW